MCNTKNTEIIRQQLWCDAYMGYIKDMSHLEATKGANNAIQEFDKAFQIDTEKLDSYIAEKEKRLELFQYSLNLRYKENVRTIKSSCTSQIHKELNFWFRDNYYCEVSRLADKDMGISYYAGIATDGIDTLMCFGKND